ncbi:MAG: cytochrome c4 [Gammaproteobacteria bacterium]|nr:cytochrome c4 [Gammaproteobacteria bacterium]MDA7962115.1 cytochrome c4 [Gammaproteobacteria bacterium]MDA7969664.1 cytochrome c4 [Gammaproteobacteria bacterium]MDA7971198.1 cytochrome c4 [Gammaproteobacteria bacterium]MDA7995466.1 cytochrome c4 [Gammaproteobacteria bacterium]
MKKLLLLAALPFVLSGAHGADSEAGKVASATCVACHGVSGNSPSDQFPNLAGQVPGYIASQLAKFKSGERAGPVMSGMAAALTPETMANLDAYYSQLPGADGNVSPKDAEAAVAGGEIYRGGYKPHRIAACMSCHGPGGLGIPPAYPRLRGQPASYIEAQLLAFKSGVRKDPIMNPIAFVLSPEQIRELALYIAALH